MLMKNESDISRTFLEILFFVLLKLLHKVNHMDGCLPGACPEGQSTAGE